MATVMSLGFVVASSPSANAVYYGYGMDLQSFCVKHITGLNPVWTSAVDGGRASWNNASAFPGDISYRSDCGSGLEVVAPAGVTWLGLYSPTYPGYHYKISLHSGNLNNHINAQGYAFANVVRSTTAHEFGHALSLNDHSDRPTNLMSSARNRNVVTGPTSAEILESNSYY